MSKMVCGTCITNFGIAANNMGEGDESNLTPIQKFLWTDGTIRSRVSSGALRRASREILANQFPEECNRYFDKDNERFCWKDPDLKQKDNWLDVAVYGHMNAQAAKNNTSESKDEPKDEIQTKNGNKKAKKERGKCAKVRGNLEVGDAYSLSEWTGDSSFNCASPGANPGSKHDGEFSDPYKTEIHPTRYVYPLVLTPSGLQNWIKRTPDILNSIRDLNHVGGNHSRFPYDFSPESVVLRVTVDLAPRILMGVRQIKDQIDLSTLVRKCELGDIDASELILGGLVIDSEDAKKLIAMGAWSGGVKKAFQEASRRIGDE